MATNESSLDQTEDGKQETLAWTTQDGLKVVARTWPLDHARAMIILVHGIGDHLGRFEWLARQLNKKGLSVFGAEWRGNGLAEGTRGYIPSFETLLDDLGQVVDRAGRAAESGMPLFLYGQSFGGLMALVYAMQRKSSLTGIIASSPAIHIAGDPPAWKIFIGKTIGRMFPKISLSTGICVEQLTHDERAQEAFRKDSLRHNRICGKTFFSMIETGQWVQAHADRLRIPTLLMHGQDDLVTSHQATRQFAESNPTVCELKLWPGLRHELHQEFEKGEVLLFVVDWIEGILGKR